ncbi:MAG: tRNA (N(6)-L-threonylcarbamoyladenosine(37)-C(2))-methylthiotransferase MtaB [Defluviitaleaceae bacterium]|nr:tRNA (N(6)-L-threonylcarbamoyladenosine(37)-C(2))-methylthiotransferase MtaB [Defluviitaleaceae bacterium]
MRLKIAIHTLGCKVNQCDADALISALCARGHDAFSTNDFNQNAHIFVVNTCTVTHVSDKKSRQMIRRARKLNPNALIACCGCLAARQTPASTSDSKADLHSDDAMPDTKSDAPNLPMSIIADFIFDARNPEEFFKKTEELVATLESASGERDKTDTRPRLPRTRAFIKIQDGCDRFCAYCIVPHVRGELTSRPPHEIAAEAENLVAGGTLEIVLTGIQLAAYGQTTEYNLPSLIRKIAAIRGLSRLRLSSIDPWAISDEFLDAVQNSPALCSHFHLSLQSGCNATLARMNRRYTTADYAAAARALRKIRPNAALTTDIIVGFPGESDADFEESLNFVRETAFAQIHVFEFSAREGTPAANFPEQILPKIKNGRGKIMRELAAKLQSNFLLAQVGTTAHVLFESREHIPDAALSCEAKNHFSPGIQSREKPSPALFIGNTENYCSVEVQSDENLVRTVQKVKITAYSNNRLTGTLLRE